MTSSAYIVYYHCHVCGQMHLVAAPRCLPAGLTEPCTLADLYPAGNMPPAILDFLTDSLLWCDQAADYIERSDPARIHLTPLPPPWPPKLEHGLRSRPWPVEFVQASSHPASQLSSSDRQVPRDRPGQVGHWDPKPA